MFGICFIISKNTIISVGFYCIKKVILNIVKVISNIAKKRLKFVRLFIFFITGRGKEILNTSPKTQINGLTTFFICQVFSRKYLFFFGKCQIIYRQSSVSDGKPQIIYRKPQVFFKKRWITEGVSQITFGKLQIIFRKPQVIYEKPQINHENITN